jgi:hypothetical protein
MKTPLSLALVAALSASPALGTVPPWRLKIVGPDVRVALLTVATALVSVPVRGQQIDIIHTGQFHGKEVSAQSGETWTALCRRDNGFVLLPCTIRVEPRHDAVVDPRGDRLAMSGRSVTADTEREILFLVRGLAGLESEPAAIVSVTSSDSLGRNMGSARGPRYMRPGAKLALVLGDVKYQLTAEGRYDPSRPKYDTLVLGYRLTLRGPAGLSQDLAVPSRFAEDGMPVVLWAGDLDRDGKLDLYMDLTDHYNVRNYALLLSSRASDGMLVKMVASRRYVGC